MSDRFLTGYRNAKPGEFKLNQEEVPNALWSKWLLVVSFIVIVAGFCFAFIFPYFMPQVLEQFFNELTGYGFDSLTADEVRFHNLLSGVIGGTMLGWGVLLQLLSYRLIKHPTDWIWSAVAVSVVVWYLCDTAATILAGSSLNVLLNTAILLLALPPLIANRQNIARGIRSLRT